MEFIENAKGFYNGITFLKRALLDARVEKDEKKEKEMISEMESYLFHLKQFLGTIMERKGNIVDLGEVWHSIDVEPQKGSWFVGQIGDNAYDTFIAEIEGKSMKNWLIGCNIKRWAYIKDLLPKGDNK